ncbi:yrdC domain-containing protein, mitochondrial-like [Pollicipes pollicipes]|uniref:yrdC domain-containing protein, mitochondrial-like n=1 Tax=Pollicipes pollicipes TaxID=41117 RepID=UPI001884AB79|nr:yrdC domain-containing protein, mitochondrial-like [Pollicipes pollicipes]
MPELLPLSDADWRLCSTVRAHLQRGAVVALPTDTVYGLAALAQHEHAVAQLYKVKRRCELKPVAICVSRVEEVQRWARVTTPEPLLRALLPGPVTLVFERSPALNPHLNPHTPLVGVRIPDHPFLRRLVARCGGPLALTSANVSGAPSPLRPDEFAELHPLLACVVDGGALGGSALARLGSTVVDLSQAGTFKIVRAGSAEAATRRVLQEEHGWTERV